MLLLVVHPAIEPFTTRNSESSVGRCGVCKLPGLVPELSPSTRSMHNMVRLLLVLSVNTGDNGLANINFNQIEKLKLSAVAMVVMLSAGADSIAIVLLRHLCYWCV